MPSQSTTLWRTLLQDGSAVLRVEAEGKLERMGEILTRYEAENDKLRATLMAIGSVFPSHVIDVEKGGRWIEDGDEPWFDYGDVHTEDCPACALSRRIEEALR